MSSTPNKASKTAGKATAGKAGKAGNAPASDLAQNPPALQRPAPAANTSSRPATPVSRTVGNSPPPAGRQLAGRTAGDGEKKTPPSSSQTTGTDPESRQRKALGGPVGSRTPSPSHNPQASGSVTTRKVSAGSATGSEKAHHPPPTIVWACDGTGQEGTNERSEAKSHRSNVYKLWHMFNKVLPAKNGKQKSIYHNGPASGMQGDMMDKLKAAASAATGSEVGQCIRDGLKELSKNYDDKEYIILIGFSRGAFVARCLHSLIHKLGGLIGSGSLTDDNINDAYKSWWDKTTITKDQLKAWDIRHTTVSHLVLFDTVNSVRPGKMGLMQADPRFAEVDSTLEGGVDYFSHAMAMNENRRLFAAIPIAVCSDIHTKGKNVYFAGVHSNIGGGHDTTGLDLISLSWMVSEIESKSRINFVTADIRDLYDSISVTWDVNFHNPSSAPEHASVLQTSRIPAYQRLDQKNWVDIPQEMRDGMFELHFSVRAIIDAQSVSNMQYPGTYTVSPLAMGNASSLLPEAEIPQAYKTYDGNSRRTITVQTASKPTVFHIKESRINRIETRYLERFCGAGDIETQRAMNNPSAVGMYELVQEMLALLRVKKA